MSLYQTAGDAGGGRTLARRDDDPHPVVTASPHGAPSSIHHKADQKPAEEDQRPSQGETQTTFAVSFEVTC